MKFFDFGLASLIEPQLESLADSTFLSMYDPYETKLKSMQEALKKAPSTNLVFHVATIIFAILIEEVSKEKKFSFVRATFYYLSSYGFVTSFAATSFLSDMTKEVDEAINYLHERKKTVEARKLTG